MNAFSLSPSPSPMASLVCFPLPKPNIIRASSSLSPSAIADSLNDKFGRKGINFHDSNGIPTVDLTVRNGSSLRLHISDAHLTSYKPRVYWKDHGFEEVLFTTPASYGVDSTKPKGGIGLVINDASESASKPSLLPSSEWTVKDVDSDAIDALQVELSCSSRLVELTYIVTLYSESMATAVILKNTGPKPLMLKSAILSHFKFKRRDGAAIQGLQGCSYCSHPPLSSPFEILSPSEAMKGDDPEWFSFGSEPQEKAGSWSLQDVPFTILKNKFSRVYAAPPAERLKPVYHTTPSKYETLDQGRELFFRVIRMGFEDIYISSPGSLSNKFGKDYFICTGPASMLVPVTVKPGEQWRGAQVIEHDNLYISGQLLFNYSIYQFQPTVRTMASESSTRGADCERRSRAVVALPLQDRVAIVTGASRGIGRAVALHLAALGARLVVNYVSSSAEADRVAAEINSSAVASGSPRAITWRADVSDPEQVKSLFDAAEQAFGSPVHILVNSAGISDPKYPFIADTSLEVFDQIFSVNARGSFLCCREAANRIKRGGGGRIILISSTAVAAATPGLGAYTVSKAAVEAMTKILAKELRGTGISVNCIAPGATATDMLYGGMDGEAVKKAIEKCPMGRLGDPKDVASFVGFLASDDGEWINGQVMLVNGGIV